MKDTEPDWGAELAAHGLLAGGREPEHERALRLALRLCDASAGAVIFRAGGPRTALGEEATSAALALDHLALQVIERAAPVLTAQPSSAFRFQAGVPLVNTHGAVLGALCVLDQRPGAPPGGTAQDATREALLDLGRIVMERLEERRGALSHARVARDAQLMRRLMAVAAEAADLESSVRSAAQALCEAHAGPDLPTLATQYGPRAQRPLPGRLERVLLRR
jgi:hypothetical protein